MNWIDELIKEYFNNEDKEIKHEYLDVLTSKGADYILWTDRFKKENLQKLAA